MIDRNALIFAALNRVPHSLDDIRGEPHTKEALSVLAQQFRAIHGYMPAICEPFAPDPFRLAVSPVWRGETA